MAKRVEARVLGDAGVGWRWAVKMQMVPPPIWMVEPVLQGPKFTSMIVWSGIWKFPSLKRPPLACVLLGTKDQHAIFYGIAPTVLLPSE